MMTETTGGLYNLQNLAEYRYQRYMQSLAENPNFFFGPLSLLLFGAASFLYELMPSGTRNYQPDFYTISHFFGAVDNGDGTYGYNHSRIPDNWTNRVAPYTNEDVGSQIFQMYALHPVAFGGNAGNGTFIGTGNFGYIENGKLQSSFDAKAASCLLYQLVTGPVPSYFNGIITPSVNALDLVASKLKGTGIENLGCPIPLT
jgi:hypothetical protein